MVDRTLSGAVVTETTDDDYILVGFVELSYDTPFRVWTGLGTLTATMPGGSSQSWVGVGDIGNIEGIKETIENAQNGVVMRLSGIDNALLANTLGEDYQGRDAKVWAAYLNSSFALIADPVLIWDGQMDVMTASDGDETGEITLQCEPRVAILRRKSESLLTDEEQQRLFPGDLGLEFVSELQGKEIIWGKVSVSATSNPRPDRTRPTTYPP